MHESILILYNCCVGAGEPARTREYKWSCAGGGGAPENASARKRGDPEAPRHESAGRDHITVQARLSQKIFWWKKNKAVVRLSHL